MSVKQMRVAAISVLAIASGLVAPGTLPVVSAASPPKLIAQGNTVSLTALEQSILTQINQYRAQHSLAALKVDSRISAQARTHSQNMASGKVPFSHDGFQQRIAAIDKVIPYSQAAENVAYNQGYSDPAKQAVQGWIKSAGHRKNIEGPFTLTGIGVAKNTKGEYYFTQIFIRQR